MDVNKNYYTILGASNTSTEKEIRKIYYKLSFKFHPDKNSNTDPSIFHDIVEAYTVLCSDERKDYDLKSRYGNNYNEYFELFDVKMDFDYNKEKENLEKFKKNDVLNIQIKIDNTFDGSVKYERWVKCKTCDGSGKDLSSKIVIKDVTGKILRTFDSDDGCDFCDGSGKDYRGMDCSFCSGKGKIGLTLCKSCNGEKRKLGKQKLKGITLTGDETKVDAMGHYSKE